MPIICPTITAYSEDEYKNQIDKIAGFAHRIQIDLTDGRFTDKATLAIEQIWWPAGFKADIHLMFKDPLPSIKELVKHKPNLIIVHAEAEDGFIDSAKFCRDHKIKAGIALLPETSVDVLNSHLNLIDHVLIFSGNLGYQGGSFADLSLLDKAEQLRKMDPGLEIGWDGGVDDQNIAELVNGGVDVLNVGGYIQNAENPEGAFESLELIADETGET